MAHFFLNPSLTTGFFLAYFNALKKAGLKLLFGGLILTVPLFWAPDACADVYAEYECMTQGSSSVRVGPVGGAAPVTSLKYFRRAFFATDFIAFQVVIDDIVMKEYGFDLTNGIYYESEPAKGDFRKYTLTRVKTDFADLKMNSLRTPATLNIFETMLGSGSAYVDYGIEPKKSFFGGGLVAGFKTDKYKYKASTGSGTGMLAGKSDKEVEIWTAKEIPGYADYLVAAERLKNEAAFYKAKGNEISEHVLAVLYAPGFPVKLRVKRGSAGGFSVQTREDEDVLAHVADRPLDRARLFYFSEAARFSTNLKIEQEDVTADPMAALSAGYSSAARPAQLESRVGGFWERFTDRMEVVYLVLIPGLFFLGLFWRWYNRESPGSAFRFGKFDLSGYAAIVVVLFVVLMAHGLAGIPHLHSFFTETTLIIAAGMFFIWLESFVTGIRHRAAAANGEGQLCSKCKRLVDRMCAVCPACNQRL